MVVYQARVKNCLPNQHSVTVQYEGPGMDHMDDPHTIPVMTLGNDPHLRGGEVFLPKPGTLVLVGQTDTGQRFIMGTLPSFTERQDPTIDEASKNLEQLSAPGGVSPPAVAVGSLEDKYGAADPVYSKFGGESYRGSLPGDSIPGDWARYGSEGNSIGVLEGGVTIFKASDLAQIIGVSSKDLIRIVAKNFELFSEFCDFSITTNEGTSALKMKASANAKYADPNDPKWDIELEMGRRGQPFFRLDINGKAGIEISGDGEIRLRGTKLLQDFISDGTAAGPTMGPSRNEIVAGIDKKEVSEKYSRTVGEYELVCLGSHKTEVTGGECSLSAGQGDLKFTSGHCVYDTAMGLVNIVKDGPPIPGARTGRNQKTLAGNHVVQVGDVTTVPWASSFLLDTWAGDIKLTTNTSGAIILSAPVPTSLTGAGGINSYGIVLNSPLVCIGQPPGVFPNPLPNLPNPIVPSLNPAVLFTVLTAYLAQLNALLDTHVHGTPAGPSSPPIVPLTPALNPQLPLMASKTVFIGGL